jgi:alkylhydroperoxidase/carboxymuconolactone decarboxylase family protein YurZ
MNDRTVILQHAISISAMHASGPKEAGVRTVEVESAISILVACASGPMLTDVRTVIFEL